jgi:hypothetical protein
VSLCEYICIDASAGLHIVLHDIQPVFYFQASFLNRKEVRHLKKELLNQNSAPVYEALEAFRNARVVPFDVTGHKHGRGNPELASFLGKQCVEVDVNSMKPLDNICHPISVIMKLKSLRPRRSARRIRFLWWRNHKRRAEHGAVGMQKR